MRLLLKSIVLYFCPMFEWKKYSRYFQAYRLLLPYNTQQKQYKQWNEGDSDKFCHGRRAYTTLFSFNLASYFSAMWILIMCIYWKLLRIIIRTFLFLLGKPLKPLRRFQHEDFKKGSERGFYVNRDRLFLIAVNRERKNLFSVNRERKYSRDSWNN